MNKINFQNGITPLNDTNLNQMQANMEKAGVVVSPTEPTTNEKVWIQKGKNLFNIKNIPNSRPPKFFGATIQIALRYL
jgi:hypothetical protein